jgi:hypothetical protein
MTTLQWMSKASKRGKAHLVDEDGKSLCSRILRPSGIPLLAPFKATPFTPLREHDQRCMFCLRVKPYADAGLALPRF